MEIESWNPVQVVNKVFFDWLGVYPDVALTLHSQTCRYFENKIRKHYLYDIIKTTK